MRSRHNISGAVYTNTGSKCPRAYVRHVVPESDVYVCIEKTSRQRPTILSTPAVLGETPVPVDGHPEARDAAVL